MHELPCAWGRAVYVAFILFGLALFAWGTRQPEWKWLRKLPWWSLLFVSTPEPRSGAQFVGCVLGAIGLIGLVFAQCR